MGNEFQPSFESLDLDDFLHSQQVVDFNAVRTTELLAHPVKKYIDQFKPYQEKYLNLQTFTFIGNDLYQGELDHHGNPIHFGRLIKENQSVVYADFSTKQAQGNGLCIFKDGSTYQGQFKAGKAQGQGRYQNANTIYEGHFQNNTFHGQGKLQTKTENAYVLEGNFVKGVIQKGKLFWEEINKQNQLETNTYEGEFNKNNQFEGIGMLKNKFGKYQGSFKDNMKHGKGRFQFANGLLYVGHYVKDLREGQGVIYNASKVATEKYLERPQLIAYEGEFQNNVPHGDGQVFDHQTNSKIKARYEEGINSGSKIYKSAIKNGSQMSEGKK